MTKRQLVLTSGALLLLLLTTNSSPRLLLFVTLDAVNRIFGVTHRLHNPIKITTNLKADINGKWEH